MDQINKLKDEIEALQNKLREETLQRMEMERRSNLLEKLAHRDPSTGLRTESYLHARVREEVDRAIRFPSSLTLLTLCAPNDRAENVDRLGQRLIDELRSTDQVFKLSKDGLAILLVETPTDGAEKVVSRISQDLEHFIHGYGATVTTFPVDANLADDFLGLALERHRDMSGQVNPNGSGQSFQSAMLH